MEDHMPFIPFPAGIAEAIINFTVDTIPCVVTQGYNLGTGLVPTLVQMDALAAAIVGWLDVSVAPRLCTNVEFDSVVINNLDTMAGLTTTTSMGTSGAAVGDPSPNQVSMVITINTGLRGRSFRGRNYWSGLPIAAQLDQKTWTAPTAAAWDLAYGALVTDIVAAGWEMEVLSRFAAGAPRTTGVATDVTGFQARQPMATQRRRLT
jgi:hypothetical protein